MFEIELMFFLNSIIVAPRNENMLDNLENVRKNNVEKENGSHYF